MDLPKNERTFYFDEEGDATLAPYQGEFTVICVPDMRARRAIEVEKSRLSADVANPTDNLAGLSIILANLRVRIVEGPKWWEESLGGFNIRDENISVLLYDKVIEQEDLWRAELRERVNPKKEEDADPGNVPEESKEKANSPLTKQS